MINPFCAPIAGVTELVLSLRGNGAPRGAQRGNGAPHGNGHWNSVSLRGQERHRRPAALLKTAFTAKGEGPPAALERRRRPAALLKTAFAASYFAANDEGPPHPTDGALTAKKGEEKGKE